ncbi:MAG: NAD(P)H-dependent oxidoreductase [Mycobacteriales bacterium]
MTSILHLDSSARSAHPDAATPSATRTLTAEVVAALVANDGETSVVYRDLDAEPLPFIGAAWVDAAFGLETDDLSALAHSETLVAELEAADVLVLGVPMYNFGVPASFKAWIDQVARVGRTFHYTATGPQGLLSGKRAVIVRSSGSDPAVLAASGVDFHTPFLRAVLGFLGIVDVEVVSVHGVEPDVMAATMAAARAALPDVVRRLGTPAAAAALA